MSFWSVMLFHWIHLIYSTVCEYILRKPLAHNASLDTVEEVVEVDGGGVEEDEGDDCPPQRRNSEAEMNGEERGTVSDEPKTMFTVNIEKNFGNIVIGNHTTIHKGKEKGSGDGPSESIRVLPVHQPSGEEVLTLENKHTKGRRRRKRKPDPMNSSPISKVPAVVRRMNEAEKRLSIFRGKGDWKAHKDAIQQLRSQYAHDEDNAVIILLLDYEDAAAACEKNEIETAMKMINNLGKHMGKLRESQSSVTQESDSEHINDIHEIIYCKCLFLASRLHCMKKDFGKAEKALKKANEELTEYNNTELKAQLHLANAHYQLFVNQSHQTGSKSELAKHVIEHTNKAEHTCAVLKNERYVYDKIKRKILLLRCKAIMQFYLDDGDKKEFAALFNNSIEELESHLWDGISPRQKVDFHLIKSNYFSIHDNVSKALDHARDALQIAQECEFNKDVLLLNDHIRKLEIFPDDSVDDGEGLVKKVLSIQTTTDGHAESNAAQMTDRGVFSTDDSESETPYLWKQNRLNLVVLPQIEENEEKE